MLILMSLSLNIYAQEYWQQEVNYKINVSLNDSTHSLNGDIKITYTNNSPDDLEFIYFHLWPNAYKNETTALCEQLILQGNTDLYNANSIDRGYISKINFKINNKKIRWEYDSKHIDIAKLYLNEPLKSGNKIEISTPFYVKIPSSDFSRLGHSEQSYQITQWYPKPAVYDKKGWHQIPYLNQGEFYSEYGSFDVAITLPKNYILGATGDLVNGKKEEAWLDSISDITKKITKFDTNLSFPPSSKKTKTLVFHQDKVHDFAWFADKRYHVLRDNIVLKNGKKVLIQAMFTNEEAPLWKNSLEYIGRSTKFYSNFVGNYPYNHVTAVQSALSAGAGMEYPNITVIGVSGSKYTLEETIMHEVGHNWFYGLLGFNEREYPWMDEGLNSFVQNQYMEKYHPDLTASSLYFGANLGIFRFNEIGEKYISYISNRFMSSYNLDQASGIPATDFTSYNYGTSVYQKTSLSMDYLQQYLGKDKFLAIFKGFYQEWKYKHPQPEDLKAYFENESGENLDWLFNDLINSTKLVDYKISSLKEDGDSLLLSIKNIGEIEAPVHINAVDDGGVSMEQKWVKGFSGKKTFTIAKKDYYSIKINSDHSLLDYNPGNNEYKPQKLFPKARKLKFKFIGTMPKDNEKYIYYSPVIAWNYNNKFMAGLLLYNHSLLEKKWEYELMPLYSFKQNTLNGSFAVRRNFYTKGFIRRLSLGVLGKRYEYDSFDEKSNLAYLKLSPEINIYFKNPAGNTNISSTARIRLVNINKDFKYYDRFMLSNSSKESYIYNILDIDYSYYNKRAINPYGFAFNIQAGNITKASLSLEYALSYNDRKNNALEMRLFVGNMFINNLNSQVDYSYKMTSFDGSDDYLYDYTYLDRSAKSGGMFAHQTTPADGGFYLTSPIGRSWGFISALNLRTGIPFTKIIKIYGNIGYTKSSEKYLASYDEAFLGEAGVLLTLFNRTFEVYFPILWTSQFQKVMDLRTDYKYSDNIRFTMRLDIMDPFKYAKKFNL